MAVRGHTQVRAAHRRAQALIRRGATQGLHAAGLHVQGESQKIVPVEDGFLRASAYTQLRANGTAVEVGYTALYAAAIHENLQQRLKGQPRPSGKGVYWGPSGQPKYLEQPAYGEARRVLAILAQASRV